MGYVKPATTEEALELLDRHGDNASVLAGGQSLMPTLNMRLSYPELLVDINGLDELRGIRVDGHFVIIGALTRHVEVLQSALVANHLPLVAEAMPHVAHVAIRNRGTFGGSVALADPAAELPACVLALGGTMVVRSRERTREIPAEDYFQGLFETARRPDELLTQIRLPIEDSKYESVFTELSQRHGDFAIAGLAARVRSESDRIIDARLVYFGSEDRPTLASSAMSAVRGQVWDEACRAAVRAALAADLNPLENLHGRADMKLHLQRVLTMRAMDTAIARAQSK